MRAGWDSLRSAVPASSPSDSSDSCGASLESTTSAHTSRPYLPMQKPAKISPKISSVSTAPVIRPSARTAYRSSSAASTTSSGSCSARSENGQVSLHYLLSSHLVAVRPTQKSLERGQALGEMVAVACVGDEGRLLEVVRQVKPAHKSHVSGSRLTRASSGAASPLLQYDL